MLLIYRSTNLRCRPMFWGWCPASAKRSIAWSTCRRATGPNWHSWMRTTPAHEDTRLTVSRFINSKSTRCGKIRFDFCLHGSRLSAVVDYPFSESMPTMFLWVGAPAMLAVWKDTNPASSTMAGPKALGSCHRSGHIFSLLKASTQPNSMKFQSGWQNEASQFGEVEEHLNTTKYFICLSFSKQSYLKTTQSAKTLLTGNQTVSVSRLWWQLTTYFSKLQAQPLFATMRGKLRTLAPTIHVLISVITALAMSSQNYLLPCWGVHTKLVEAAQTVILGRSWRRQMLKKQLRRLGNDELVNLATLPVSKTIYI